MAPSGTGDRAEKGSSSCEDPCTGHLFLKQEKMTVKYAEKPLNSAFFCAFYTFFSGKNTGKMVKYKQ